MVYEWLTAIMNKRRRNLALAAEKYVLRLPPGMRERIRKVAAANRRSMNGEIVYQLEQAMPDDETKAATGGTFGDITPAAAQEKAALAGAANANQGNGAAQDDYRRE